MNSLINKKEYLGYLHLMLGLMVMAWTATTHLLNWVYVLMIIIFIGLFITVNHTVFKRVIAKSILVVFDSLIILIVAIIHLGQRLQEFLTEATFE